jgi:hypothetical protein
MRSHLFLATGCFAAIVMATIVPAAARQSRGGASAAAAASPELVSQLSTGLGSSKEQAAGAAGALFGVAKSRLKPNDFAQVSKAVPGMSSLLGAAPAMDTSGAAGALSQLGGSAGGLAAAASAFSKLGLSPDLVSKAVPIITQFVTKSGGANVANLLAGALK